MLVSTYISVCTAVLTAQTIIEALCLQLMLLPSTEASNVPSAQPHINQKVIEISSHLSSHGPKA